MRAASPRLASPPPQPHLTLSLLARLLMDEQKQMHRQRCQVPSVLFSPFSSGLQISRLEVIFIIYYLKSE